VSSASPRTRRRGPDVLLIVLDCVDAAFVLGGPDSIPGLRTIEQVGREGLVFDHAVSPASWTLPSHASMFTGLYPWDHAVHSLGVGRLGSSFSTLAQDLQRTGYVTGAFSSNPLIWDALGKAHGFEVFLSGDGRDCLVRGVRRWESTPRREPPDGGGTRKVSWIARMADRHGSVATIFPVCFDAFGRAIAMLDGSSESSKSEVSPWIESEFQSWIRQASPDRPIFSFINLMDAHEPYFGIPRHLPSFREWLRLYSVPQGPRGLFGSSHSSRDPAQRSIRELYRQATRVLDQRLKEILDGFRNIRDWDNSIVIITSDHGQGFGGPGFAYHHHGSSPALHRVPLIVRAPSCESRAGTRVTHWVSTREIREFVVNEVRQIQRLPNMIPGEVQYLVAEREAKPVLSLADVAQYYGGVTPAWIANWGSRHIRIIGYSHEYCCTVNPFSGELEVRRAVDSVEARVEFPMDLPELKALQDSLTAAARAYRQTVRPGRARARGLRLASPRVDSGVRSR